MDLSKMSLNQFVNIKSTTSTPLVFDAIRPNIHDNMIGIKIVDLGRQYFIHKLDTNDPGDVVLLSNRDVVGWYWTESLIIHDNHQKKGLSVPLVLWAVKDRDDPSLRTLSLDGEAALTKAWNVVNGLDTSPWTIP